MQGALLPFVDFEDATQNVYRLALGAFGSKAELCGADLVVEVEIVGKVPCIMENFLNKHNNLRKSPGVRDSRGRQTVVEVIKEKKFKYIRRAFYHIGRNGVRARGPTSAE